MSRGRKISEAVTIIISVLQIKKLGPRDIPLYVITLTNMSVVYGVMSSELNPDSLAQGPGYTYQMLPLPYEHKETGDLLPRSKECGEFLKSIEMKIRGKRLMVFLKS